MTDIKLIQSASEVRADSRNIAQQLGVKPENTLGLIERYLPKFKRFGVVPFQTEKPLPDSNGGRQGRFALLNEDQCYFLLSLSRNTERLVELKASLIMAFREARYGYACQTLEARKKEASQSGSGLARWRYAKPDLQHHVFHMREQLRLPLDVEVTL